jgi:hypothetical protein
MLGVNVLVIVGSRESSFSGTLAELAGENSPDGVTATGAFGLIAKPNCPPPHHRDGDVVPENNCAGARQSDNKLLARPPRTVFIEELP